MKYLICAALLLAPMAHANNTDNDHNSVAVRTLFFGSNAPNKNTHTFKGTTKDCDLTVSSTAFGVTFTILDSQQYFISRSAQTSSEFKMSQSSGSLKSSQIALSTNERGTDVTQQSLSLQYGRNADHSIRLKSITINSTSDSSGLFDGSNFDQLVFPASDLRTKTCTFE